MIQMSHLNNICTIVNFYFNFKQFLIPVLHRNCNYIIMLKKLSYIISIIKINLASKFLVEN